MEILLIIILLFIAVTIGVIFYLVNMLFDSNQSVNSKITTIVQNNQVLRNNQEILQKDLKILYNEFQSKKKINRSK